MNKQEWHANYYILIDQDQDIRKGEKKRKRKQVTF